MKKFFITTPIYYINDIPHIGHTCTTVAADIAARTHKALGEEVFFLTGTDEHGQKVAESAAKENLKPIDYCDKISPRFEEAWKNLNIGFDFFIRTTNPNHEKVVADLLQKIYDNGDAYKDKYEGWYCIGCEKFLTETEMIDGHCPLHPPEKTVKKSEENWFFRLSKYVPKLIELIENDETNYIFPEGKRSEILAKLKAGVRDISLSRENVEWGICVPWDTKQTVYVWFDALINYYSATQFVEGRKDFWPASVHLIGKEILWFHTVIWQAMLLSAGFTVDQLPKKVYIHSFYMIDGQKMSKSLGNVISPGQLVELFGVDGARYLIARSFPTENDSDVGIERFKERYNADLANNLGNLVSRVAKLGEGKNYGYTVNEPNDHFIDLVDSFNFNEAIDYIFKSYIDSSNELLNLDKPWTLDKDDPKRDECISTCRANLQRAAYYLSSVIPDASEKIKKCFEGEIKTLEKPLFPRI
ncbi:MAG: methionine--tRNA ligase [Candidatus Shapirobacteria bacterium]|nr:methionine--tRNA ligase [Candidatus Shapirobacteria bacterium]